MQLRRQLKNLLAIMHIRKTRLINHKLETTNYHHHQKSLTCINNIKNFISIIHLLHNPKGCWLFVIQVNKWESGGSDDTCGKRQQQYSNQVFTVEELSWDLACDFQDMKGKAWLSKWFLYVSGWSSTKRLGFSVPASCSGLSYPASPKSVSCKSDCTGIGEMSTDND